MMPTIDSLSRSKTRILSQHLTRATRNLLLVYAPARTEFRRAVPQQSGLSIITT